MTDKSKVRNNTRLKKDQYIKTLERQQLEFLQGQQGKIDYSDSQSTCCFGLIKMKSSMAKKDLKLKRDNQNNPQNSSAHRKHTVKPKQNVNSIQQMQDYNDWQQYLTKQLQNAMDSSSLKILGFNWPEQLNKFIQEYSPNFNQNKFKSALFYLNYSARQMRTMSMDLDTQLRRKETLMKMKLKKLDKYPKAQNFFLESEAVLTESSILQSPRNEKIIEQIEDEERNQGREVDQRKRYVASAQIEETKYTGDIIETEPLVARQVSKISMDKKAMKDQDTIMTGQQKTENSMMSLIQQNVHKVKNIEDFNAPLSNIDKVLQSLLYQLRLNLNEIDHPINLIVKKFQDIILWNVNAKKNQLQRTSRGGNTHPIFEVVDIPDVMSQQDRTEQSKSRAKSIKMSTAKIKKNLRATYDRQTLQQLPPEIQFAQVIIAEVKKLICILYGSLIRFYISVVKFDDLHEMREDLIELLTSLVVRGDLSKLLVQLSRLVTYEEEQILTFKYEDLKEVSPEVIGISKYFTLNQSSYLIELFEKLQAQEQDDEQQIQGDVGGSIFNIIDQSPSDPRIGSSETHLTTKQFNPLIQRDEEQDVYRSKSCLLVETVLPRVVTQDELKRNNLNSNPIKLVEIDDPVFSNEFKLTRDIVKERILSKPYLKAIHNLRKLRDFETPIDKMRCITQTSKLIVQSIDEFWKGIKEVEKKKLTLDADELLMIFIYVTLKSKIGEFYAHLKLINEFSTDTLRQSKLGYYTSTIEVALSEILNLDKANLQKQIDENQIDNQHIEEEKEDGLNNHIKNSTNQLSFNLRNSIKNAQKRIEENIQESLQSDFPLQAAEDFEFLDQYDQALRETQEFHFQQEDADDPNIQLMQFEGALGNHYLEQ